MKMKCLILSLCLIIQSCSVNFQGRAPSSEKDFSGFISEMKDFKAKVMGAESDPQCTPEQLDDDFNRMMALVVQKDSCAPSKYALDREEFNQRSCPKIKTKGYFDRLIEKMLKEEKAKKQLTLFHNRVDEEFLSLQKRAHKIVKELNGYVSDEANSKEARIELLNEYAENVLLPIRDLVVVMKSYLPNEDDGKKYYVDLQPFLSASFVKSLDKEQWALVANGPKDGPIPFYLEIKPQGGMYQLRFLESYIIKRDILTLLKAPTVKNYILGLKWMTIHMMLSQAHLYDILLGNKSEMAVPSSCQSEANGNLPARLNFSYEEGQNGEAFVENILVNHGLVYREGDATYFDYYLDNVDKDPTKNGYSGLFPFENFKNALKGSKESRESATTPQFDDITHFPEVLSHKLSEAMAVFRGTVKGQNVIFNGQDIFQKMMGEYRPDEIAEIKLANGEVEQIYPGKQNLSPYLLEVMQKYHLLDYSELITARMKKKMEGQRVKIDFPSLYSSPAWRDWSLKTLAEAIYRNREAPEDAGLYLLVRKVCGEGIKRNEEVKRICAKGNKLQNLSNFLSEFRAVDQYVPTRKLEEAKFVEIYPHLEFMWTAMRDELGLLPEAQPFEMNFLLDQMSAGNPWARLRLGYMVALDQLESEDSHAKKGKWSLFSRKEESCDLKDKGQIKKRIMIAGKILGLQKPLSYDHADHFLSNAEKAAIWNNIASDIHKNNSYLFSAKNRDQSYYSIMENISGKTILTEEAALSAAASLSDKVKGEIREVSKATGGELGLFFLKLYNLRDPAKQQELFERFSAKNGIDNAFSSKLAFLALDQAYKKPIYKELIKEAAMARKIKVLSELKKFCELDANDDVQFKNIFYSTIKTQNDLNQMAGVSAVPEEVMAQVRDRLNSMTASEWSDMWLSIGSGVMGMSALGISALIMGGACTALSGGLCAPLAGTMLALGVGAVGSQIVVTEHEIDRKYQADVSVERVKAMEDLGFTDVGSSEEVSRSFAWSALEAVSIVPLIGISSKSLALGPKILYVSAKELMRKTGKTSFNAVVKSVVQSQEVRAAQYLLGGSSISKNAGLDAKAVNLAREKVDKVKKLFVAGKIDLKTTTKRIAEILAPIKRAKSAWSKSLKGEFGQIAVTENKKQIDSMTGKMIANYFDDNPKDLLRLIQSYSGEKLNKAVRIMDELEAPERIGNRLPIFGGAKDWFLRMRNESLAKNAGKIQKIEKELASLGNNKNALEGYVTKNLEDLTDIFLEIPMKKREVPYFVFIQGMPDFDFIKGRRIPFLSRMSEGQMMKRIVTARARLVYESYKAQARQTFRLKKFVQSETTFNAFKSFQKSIADLANKKSGAQSKEIMTSYRKLEEALSRKLFDRFTQNGERMDYKKFKSLVNNPKNLEEEARAEVIWESVPADELMGLKEVNQLAHKAVQELANYDSADSFERFLSALKILVINRNPSVLEVM